MKIKGQTKCQRPGKSYVINTIHIKMFTKEEVALHENVSIPVPVRLQKMIYETLTTQMS